MYKTIQTLNFKKETKLISTNNIVGGTINKIEFIDGTVIESTIIPNLIFFKFNCPIEIQENGDVLFPKTDTNKSIPANTKLKLSTDNGLEIII